MIGNNKWNFLNVKNRQFRNFGISQLSSTEKKLYSSFIIDRNLVRYFYFVLHFSKKQKYISVKMNNEIVMKCPVESGDGIKGVWKQFNKNLLFSREKMTISHA